MGMCGDLHQLFCPYQGDHIIFRSKKYMAFTMPRGYSYWEFLGCPRPTGNMQLSLPKLADAAANKVTTVVKINDFMKLSRAPKY